MPTFQQYTSGLTARGKGPRVTLQKRGVISLSQSAYTLLDHPNAVALSYDQATRVIGIQRTNVDDDGAHYVRSPSGNDAGPHLLSARDFLKHYNITTDGSRRWDAYAVVDLMLCIDLNEPGTPVTSNRAGHSG
jgi:hypothetical protein